MNRKDRRAAQKQGNMPRPASAAPAGPAHALAAVAADHFRSGQFAEARRACRDALAFDPNHFDALHLLGVIALRFGDNEAALDLLGKAIALNDRDLQSRMNMGLVLTALGRRDEAVAQFTRAVGLNPTFVPALICLGNGLKEQGRLDEAATQYRRALAVKPDAMAHYNLGNVLTDQGKLDEAVAQYRRALAFEPASAPTLNNLGRVLDIQGQRDEALGIYRRALALAPDNADVHNNLGVLFAQQGRYDEAASHYRQALTLKPAFLDAYNNLALVLKKQDKLAEAFACLEHASTLDPEHEGVQLNLCATLYELSLTDRAAAASESARLLATHGHRTLIRRGLSGLVSTGVDERHDREYSRALFDQFASTFDNTLAELGYSPAALAQALDLDAQRGPAFDILDAGCGTGMCGALLKPVARSLVGVDLSQRMLEKARARSIYDRLEHDDAAAFMVRNTGAFDLVVLADVLTYVGDPARVLRAVHAALRRNGRVAVSTENLDREGQTDGFRLWPSGRYKHSRRYLEDAFGDAGFIIGKMIESELRREAGNMIGAWIVVAEKPA